MRRIIQAGVGGMGVGWTDRVAESKRWEAVAYVDINRTNLKAAAERHGMPKSRCFTDVHRALAEVEADALLDVTPQQARKEVCCAAFERGLDVLAEKPLADNIRNAKTIVARAARLRRTFMIAQNYRYQPLTQTAKRFIRSADFGELGYVGVQFHKGPHFGGYREAMAFPLVLDMSIHHFDMMRCILDADVKAVQASSIGAPWNWFSGDATIMAQIEMTTGLVVNYFGSWVSTGVETPWNGDWRFEGTHGALVWERDRLSFCRKDNRKAVRLVKLPKVHQAYLLDAFADGLDSAAAFPQTGAEPETSGRNNLNSFATTYAVVRAAKERRRVLVSELLK